MSKSKWQFLGLAIALALVGPAARAQTTFNLTIQGNPTNFGAPAPLGYGTWTNIADNTWLTNSVASPASNSTVCCVCTGWTAAYTNGSNVIGDSSTQAVFQLTNNVVLTWYWSNSAFYLAVTAAPNGSLTPDMTGWYTNGTQVVLSATGNTGYAFSQWTGDVPPGGHTNNPLTVTMDQARVIQANFASNSPQTKIWTGTNNWTSATNWSPAGMPGPQDTAVIQSGVVTLSDPTWVAVVTNNATLTFSGWNTILTASNVVVAAGAAVNHAGPITNEATTNRVYFICTNLALSGSIAVSGRGYTGGTTNHRNGFGLGGGGGVTGGGPGGGGNGGQGGAGWDAGGGTVYGSPTNPVDMGSGGGICGSAAGGNGGGAVRLEVAGTLTVNGSITANGTDGASPPNYNGTAGGAGGSIWITAQTMTGTGLVSANGGLGKVYNSNPGGGGGGGKVAVYYNVSTHTNIQARGGNGGGTSLRGGVGTVYLKAAGAAGILRLDNGTASFSSTAGTWLSNSILNTCGEISIDNGGVLKHPATTTNANSTNGLHLSIPVLTIGSYGSINVTGLGWPGGNTNAGQRDGFGLGGGKGAYSGSGVGPGGGGYGGAGGNGGTLQGGPTYGSMMFPAEMGSGGGLGGPARGGYGGGSVRLDISEILTFNGQIIADGTAGAGPPNYCGSAGGSGGSIWITAETMTGSGALQANGGIGQVYNTPGGGGGGGGRIAIHVFKAPLYSPGCYRGTWTVNGGAGGGAGGLPGSLGTVYLDFKSRGTVLSTW